MSRNLSSINFKVSPELNQKQLDIIKNETFPLCFIFDLDYIKELSIYTKHPLQQEQLEYAKEFKYFKINNMNELIHRSTYNQTRDYGDFFSIRYDNFSWNFLTIKEIISSTDIQAIIKLSEIKSLRIKFDE